jgi:hypothetical protein
VEEQVRPGRTQSFAGWERAEHADGAHAHPARHLDVFRSIADVRRFLESSEKTLCAIFDVAGDAGLFYVAGNASSHAAFALSKHGPEFYKNLGRTLQ